MVTKKVKGWVEGEKGERVGGGGGVKKGLQKSGGKYSWMKMLLKF